MHDTCIILILVINNEFHSQKLRIFGDVMLLISDRSNLQWNISEISGFQKKNTTNNAPTSSKTSTWGDFVYIYEADCWYVKRMFFLGLLYNTKWITVHYSTVIGKLGYVTFTKNIFGIVNMDLLQFYDLTSLPAWMQVMLQETLRKKRKANKNLAAEVKELLM